MCDTKKILKFTLSLGAASLMLASAQAQFAPRNLAVLRAGDNTNYPWSSLGGAHQSPSFIDEFSPTTPIVISSTNTGTNGPIYSVYIPTNDPVSGMAAMWFNGHAGTEGYLSQSGDGSVVTFSGYGGDILADSGTPSGLNIPRGICVIDASGNTYIPYEGSDWYGLGAGSQTNPRGVVSDDGTNNFFGSGSLDGTEWYSPTQEPAPQTVQNLNSSRQVKIINGTFYTSLQQGDGGGLYPQGIYNLTTLNGPFPVTLPEGQAFYLNLVVPASASYPSVDGFDMNPQRNIAYMADDSLGVQKYVEVNGNWQLACAFAITNNTTTNAGPFPLGFTGCFGLVVDWTGSYPVVFATTTEGSGGYANSNRLIRIDDNYNYSDGGLYSIPVTTLATAWSGNVAFRGLAWTPNRAPLITSEPASQTVTTGSSVAFTVVASNYFNNNTYEWLVDGILDPTQTNATYNVAAAAIDGTYQVVITNNFGAVTSTVANLTVTATPTAPAITSPVPALTLSNAVYDTVTIPVTASGSTPLSYQWWYFNGGSSTLLSDGGDYVGSATGTLTINVSSSADAGSYYVVANNSTGTPASNLVATLSIVNQQPIIFDNPIGGVVASNGVFPFNVSAYPLSVSYQWYQGSTALQNSSHWSGATSDTLVDEGAQASDATNYYVVVSLNGYSVTSSVAILQVEQPAPYSVLPYTSAGSVYLQNFDTMPDAGTFSVNNSTTAPTAPVPVTIPSNSVNSITYDVANPFDFAAPVSNSVVNIGTNQFPFGGLNLPAMTGWYSSDLNNEQIQATSGDQTTGLIVSFGCTNATPVNPLYPTNNRALGMIASPASAPGGAGTAADAIFALRVLNVTGQTLTNFNLSYVSELWRNTLTTNVMTNWFYVDPFGTNSTPTNNWTGGLTNLQFGTNIFITHAFNKIFGTNQPLATTNMSFVNVPLSTAWTPGGILWIVWEENTAQSGAQGIGIDNLVFSAGAPTLSIAPGQPNLSYSTNAVSGAGMVTISWPQMFSNYTLQSSLAIGPNAAWQAVATVPTVWEGMNYVTLPASDTQEYFRLQP